MTIAVMGVNIKTHAAEHISEILWVIAIFVRENREINNGFDAILDNILAVIISDFTGVSANEYRNRMLGGLTNSRK